VEASNPLAPADDSKSARFVKLYAGGVLRKNSGLQRSDAVLLRTFDESLQ